MKVLVVGSLPPPLTDRARGLLAEIVRRRREGETIEVLSPTPHSVAHRYLELPGPASALEIGLAARGAEALVVQLQPGFPFEEAAGRTGRAIGLGALVAVLRHFKGGVTLRLHSLHDLPGGAGGRAAEALWAVADRIEVGDEETRARLSSLFGEAVQAKIELAVAPLKVGGPRDVRPVGAEADLDAVTAVVRARAASERASLLADPVDGGGQVRAEPRAALWEWVPTPGLGVPDWANPKEASAASTPGMLKAARKMLYAAEARALTRPLAKGARILRELARQP